MFLLVRSQLGRKEVALMRLRRCTFEGCRKTIEWPEKFTLPPERSQFALLPLLREQEG